MADLIRKGLSREGFAVDVAADGEECLAMATETTYDAIVLDIMLPGISGFEACRRLRGESVWTPVLMLTARDSVDDRVTGLDAGADDYLVKPFAWRELLARLRALIRRGDHERPTVLEVGDLRLDPATRAVHRGDAAIDPSAKELALRETLIRPARGVLPRAHLLERAWDVGYQGRSNVVDVYVGHLRAKIDVPFGRQTLETGRGRGYRVAAADGGPAAPRSGSGSRRPSRPRWGSSCSRPASCSTSA